MEDLTHNEGGYQEQFRVLIAGSNGYVNKTLASIPGYSRAKYLGDVAINAPYDANGYDTYMGSKLFTAGPFNTSLCAEYCDAQTAYDLAHQPANGAPVQTCQVSA